MAKYQVMNDPRSKALQYDEVGVWSELKLEILKKYASAYSQILTKKGLHHSYIEGFAGAGHHVSKRSKELIPGSPLNALNVTPPFEEYHLIDLDESRVNELRKLTVNRHNVRVYSGDCNKLLVSDVFPEIKFAEFKRALCILDPYGLQLKWQVIAAAAQLKTIEIFLNFPVLDINRNVLWRHDVASQEKINQMNDYWGDESWREVAYRTDTNLFGEPEKQPNEVIAEAFRKRLCDVAGFAFVPEPAPMRNSRGAIVYYLFFAAHQRTAQKIVNDIFAAYRKRGVLHG
jgi:three-Cys-motif partner protein